MIKLTIFVSVFVMLLAQSPEPLLTAGQLLLVGFVSTLLAQGLKLLFAKLNRPLTRDWVTTIAFIVSVAMAYFFMEKPAQTMQDPIAIANYLLEQATAVLGVATVIYNVILEKVFEKIGWTKEAVSK